MTTETKPKLSPVPPLPMSRVAVSASFRPDTPQDQKTPGPSRDGGIAFVSVTPNSANGAVNPVQLRLVKRHVMLDYYRKQPKQHVKTRTSPSRPKTFKRQTGRLSRPKSSKQLLNLRPKPGDLKHPKSSLILNKSSSPKLEEASSQGAPGLHDMLSAFQKDPFMTFPINANTETHVLFVYYMNELDNKSMAVDPERDFVPVALGDPACFHITMAITAQIQNLRRFGAHTSQYWYHRGKAIKFLNSSLSNMTDGITVAMLCTTGMLAYTDTFHNGPVNTSKQHLIGLLKLVQLKGGLDQLELCMMVLRLVTWCELQGLIRLKHQLSHLNSLSPGSQAQLEASPTPSLPNQDRVSYPIELFHDIRTVVRINDEIIANPSDQKPRIAFNQLVFNMLNRILRPHAEKTNYNDQQPIDVDTRSIIQMSIILFSYTSYPALTVAGAFSRSIGTNLKQILEAYDVRMLQAELHCWVLVSGATAIQDAANHKWFISRLAGIVAELKIQDYTSFVSILKEIVWVDGTFDERCHAIWLEIGDVPI